MTNILDQKQFFLLFMDVSEAKCYNQLKWNIVLFQKVEILKMASKMAVSYASTSYMTDILDKTL